MRYRRSARPILAALTGLIAATAAAAADVTILTGEGIAARVASASLAVRTGPGYAFPVAITLRADGSMEGVSANGYIDIGRWWTRGDTLCHQWEGWFDGLRKCHAVTAESGGLVLVRPDAKLFDASTMKLRK